MELDRSKVGVRTSDRTTNTLNGSIVGRLKLLLTENRLAMTTIAWRGTLMVDHDLLERPLASVMASVYNVLPYLGQGRAASSRRPTTAWRSS